MFFIHEDLLLLSLVALRAGVPVRLVALLNEAYTVGFLQELKRREED